MNIDVSAGVGALPLNTQL